MPGSVRDFYYAITPQDPEAVQATVKRVRKILSYACIGDDRITCLEVEGEALGTIIIRAKITGRDQWWTRQLAQDVVNVITWGLEQQTGGLDLDLRSVRLPTHEARGYVAGNRKARSNRPRPKRETLLERVQRMQQEAEEAEAGSPTFPNQESAQSQ